MKIILKKKKLSPGDVNNMVRLYLCLLFNFLFINTHANLCLRLPLHIEELDDVENLDWADAIDCCTLVNMKVC